MDRKQARDYMGIGGGGCRDESRSHGDALFIGGREDVVPGIRARRERADGHRVRPEVMKVGESIPLAGTVRGRDTVASRKQVWLPFGIIVATVIVGGSVAAYWTQRQPREDGNVAAASAVSPEMREIDSTVTT